MKREKGVNYASIVCQGGLHAGQAKGGQGRPLMATNQEEA